MKGLLNHGYTQNELVGIIIAILAIALFIFLALVRYRRIDIYQDRYVLRSIVASRIIYKHDIDAIKKYPLNLFDFKWGSNGIMGIISLNSSGEMYNVSDVSNTIRIELKNHEVIHVSCDKPEEIV